MTYSEMAKCFVKNFMLERCDYKEIYNQQFCSECGQLVEFETNSSLFHVHTMEGIFITVNLECICPVCRAKRYHVDRDHYHLVATEDLIIVQYHNLYDVFNAKSLAESLFSEIHINTKNKQLNEDIHLLRWFSIGV